MYSRLDLFLISHHLLTWRPEVDIASPIWPNHAPVYLFVKFPNAPKRFSSWKIKDNLLKDQFCLGELRTSTHIFMAVHANDPSPLPLQWEALKCVFRGTLIKHGARLKREKRAKLESCWHIFVNWKLHIKDPTLHTPMPS